MFGVCQLTFNLKMSDLNLHQKILYGSFSDRYSNIFLGIRNDERKGKSNINQFSNEDVIEIEYVGEETKVIVRNITSGTQAVSFVVVDESIPLYFVVSSSKTPDEVEIIRGESY